MSQIDKLHFMPTFVWIIVLFIFWYMFIIGLLLPVYYKTLRGRYLYEKNLWSKIKEKEIILQLLDIFYSTWIVVILKNFKIHNILVNFKNLFFFVEKEIDNNSKNFLSDFDKLYTHDKYEIIDAEKSNINFNIDNDNFFKKNQHMLKNNISRFYQENLDDLGYVFKVSDDIVYARGLLKVQMSEMVKFEKEGESIYGIVNYLDNEGVVGVTVLGDASKITAQTVVNRTLKQPKIGAGYGYVGRVVNPLGEAIDGNGKINFELEVNIEKNAPGIIERKPVREPLETGIKFIDAMIPIGCGQRD